MMFENLARQMRPEIEASLHRTVEITIEGAAAPLGEMLQYHLGWAGDGAGQEAQGKRIRPLLVTLSCSASGGNWIHSLPAAAAVELLHNFSLIHDDIQDVSPLRRGRPTVWKKWGVAQAINAGDAMFTLANLVILDLHRHLPAEEVLGAARLLQRTCLQLTQGQYLDISYEGRKNLPLEAYWPMVSGKTAALLAACTELGARVSRVEEERQAAFRDFGHSLGLAFQVQDDLLGIWGDAARTGKSTHSDLVEGKNSIPVLYGLSRGGRFATRWAEGSVQPEETAALAALLAEEGAYDYTLRKADEWTGKAMQSLEKAQAEGPAAEALHELAGILLKRKS